MNSDETFDLLRVKMTLDGEGQLSAVALGSLASMAQPFLDYLVSVLNSLKIIARKNGRNVYNLYNPPQPPRAGLRALARKLKEKLQVLNLAGITPTGATLDTVALFNLVASSKVLPKKGTAALLEFSGEQYRLMLARGGRLVFMRVVNTSGMGPGELAQRVARGIKSSCLVAGISEQIEMAVAVGDELDVTFQRHLEEKLKISLEIFNPFKVFPASTTEEESGTGQPRKQTKARTDVIKEWRGNE